MDFIKYNRPKLPRNKYGIQNGVFYSGGSVFNSLGSGSASGSSVSLANYYTKPETDEIAATKLDKSIWDGVFRIDENGNLRCSTNFIGEKEVSAYGEGDTASSTVVVVDNLTSNLTDAALSANQGRVLKELIDTKTVDVDLTGYAKQDWVSQNFISVIPSEYITETELNTVLNDYYTKAQIDGKGYLTAIPSEYVTETELSTSLNNYYTKTQIDNKGYLTSIPAEYVTETELGTELDSYYTKTEINNKGYLTSIPAEYVTETELNTELDSYYTKNETDTKLDAKLNKSVWDGVFRIDNDGNLRCTTNFIGEKEVSAYGAGDTASSTVVVVDNLTSNLTDAALSANQGRVLKELIDTKTVDVDLTDYAQKTWVSQNFISVIPSEYITETELNTTLNSYYTKTQIDNKGYLTAIPSEYITSTELETELGSYYTKAEINNKGYLTSIPAEYVTETELNTSLNSYYTKTQIDNKGYLTAVPSEYVTETELNTELGSYYTKNETDAKLDTKLNKSVWDGVFRIDENGDLRCTKNFIGEKEVSAYGAGDTASSTVVVVDNLNSSLTDAALSANQGRVLKELIDSKTVDVDLTGYAKQDWVSQNFISVIPSEYITETELNTALSSYYTKTQIDNKGYLTAIPAEYVTDTELNTSLNSYYTKTQIDNKGYLTVIPSEYVTDTELSTSLNSYYTKTQIDNKGYLTAIPSEYVTDTELSTSLNSYYTKTQIDNKGYLTAIPAEYVTDTELNTSLSSYYTKNETDTKFNLKVDKTTWDSLFLIDSNGDLHVKTNLIGEKEVTAYNIGTEDPGVIVEGGSEWYNIHTKRLTSKTTTATDMYVVIENLDVDIVNNPDNYRIVLLTWKRKKGEGNRWRVPMFSPRWHADTGAIVSIGTPCVIDWNNTWWPITGNETKWWNTTNAKYTDVFDTTVNTLYVTFKNHNKKMRFGCCIMKKMEGVGTHGWQRVSNISEIMLFAIKGGKHFCMVK